MKIGIVHLSFKILGGAELCTLCLVDALKKTKHLITLYTIDPPDIQETENFKIISSPQKKSRFFSAYQKYDGGRKNLYKKASNEDVLVIIGGGFMYNKNEVANIVFYCHAPLHDKIKFKNKKFRVWGKIHMKKAQIDIKNRLLDVNNPKVRLLTNSEYNKRNLMKIFEKDCKVVYPPVKIEKFLMNFDHVKNKKVITLCRIDPTKNLNFALDVIIKTKVKYQLSGYAKTEDQIKLYQNLNNMIKGHENIVLTQNLTENEKENLLASSKVYFHTAEETFGITVVEAIASGCIPIVPNNSAHPETVPFPELRFENKSDAVEKLKKAIDGEYDYLRPELKKHVVQFSEKKFQEQMIREIERKIN